MNFYLLSIESRVTKHYTCCGGGIYSKLESFDSSEVRKAFSKFVCSWINPFECTFLICSCEDIFKPLRDKIIEVVKPSNVMLLEINIKNYSGWLPADCWEWIKENQGKKVHEITNTNSTKV